MRLPPKTKPSIHSNEAGTRFKLWPAATTTDYWQKARRTDEDSWIVLSSNLSKALALVQFRDADQYQDGDDRWYVQMIDKSRVSASVYGPFDTLPEALTLVWRKA